jgi:hypothetical protein
VFRREEYKIRKLEKFACLLRLLMYSVSDEILIVQFRRHSTMVYITAAAGANCSIVISQNVASEQHSNIPQGSTVYTVMRSKCRGILP